MALFNRTARFAPARHARATTLLPLALLCSVFALTPASVVAQSSGGEGKGAASAGTANSEDPLIPTDPSGNPADSGPGRMTNSIGEEPDRIKRGGGAAGANLEECMKLWDPSTHMTKERWKVTCERLGR